MTPATAAVPEVDVLIFEIAGTRYGTDVTQVTRISRSGTVKPVRTALGETSAGTKALVFNTPAGERALPVDRVHGVERLKATDLRRMPVATAAPAVFAGAWLSPAATILLLDMSQLVHFAERKIE